MSAQKRKLTRSLSNATSMPSALKGGCSAVLVLALLRDWGLPLVVGAARAVLDAPGWFSLFGALAGGSPRAVTIVKSEDAILFGRIPLNIVVRASEFALLWSKLNLRRVDHVIALLDRDNSFRSKQPPRTRSR